ncbi:MAG: aminopeptidase [Bacillota bacterium]
MRDPRIEKLAHTIVHYSLDLQKGENLLIEVEGHDNHLAQAIVLEAYQVGGIPTVSFIDMEILRKQILYGNLVTFQAAAASDRERMETMHAYVLIRANGNSHELSDVPADKKDLYWREYYHHVHESRWAKTKWLVLSYPNAAAAQLAGMSTSQFEDRYFEVCTLDYEKLSTEMEILANLLRKTESVRIEGLGTDLTLSIKGMPVQKDAGHQNLPDGEVFCVPDMFSANGIITFNTPVLFRGRTYDNISFTFEDGQIVKASANDTLSLQEILNIDTGSRYIGELGFGLNPYIREPIGDILFDEKIWGSLHVAIGSAPIQGDRANLSSIHWDIVLNQTEKHGGGKVWFDGVLVRENGVFVLQELQGLNI